MELNAEVSQTQERDIVTAIAELRDREILLKRAYSRLSDQPRAMRVAFWSSLKGLELRASQVESALQH